MISYDFPDLYKDDRFLIEKVRSYNNQIVPIHNKLSIPLPYYGNPQFYNMHGRVSNPERKSKLALCIEDLTRKNPNRDNSTQPTLDYLCEAEMQKWELNLSERRKFHREFCQDKEELAYLDFYAYWNTLSDPYEKCKNLRDEKQISKDKELLQDEVATYLARIQLPIKILSSDRKMDSKLNKTLIELETLWESYIIRIGVLDVYINDNPLSEVKEINGKSWDTFIPKDLLETSYKKIVGDLETKYGAYLRSQMYSNVRKEYNTNSLQELIRLSQLIQTFSNWKSDERTKIKKAESCIKNLFKKNSGMSPGFYLGFYKKYSQVYNIDTAYSKSLEEPCYKSTYDKIQNLHWRQNQGSDLFQIRLDFIQFSCELALKKNEKDLNLKYFSSLVGE